MPLLFSIVPFAEQLLPAVRRQLRLVPLVVVLGLMSAALESAGIGLVMPLLDLLTGNSAQNADGLAERFFAFADGLEPAERFFAITLSIVALIGLKNLVVLANSALGAFIYGGTGHAIRNALASRLIHAEFPLLLREQPGRLLNILSNESWRTADAIQAWIRILVSGCAALILTIFLLLLSWQMTLGVAAGIAVFQGLQLLITRSLKRRSAGLTRANGVLASRMLHIVNAARAIRLFGQEARERDVFDAESDKVRRKVLEIDLRKAAVPPLMEFLHISLFLAVISAAFLTGTNFAVMATFLILLYRIQPHIRLIQDALIHLKGWSGSLSDVAWLLEAPRPPAPSNNSLFDGLQKEIRLENVTFRFESAQGRNNALNGVSFAIRHGRATALVGRSGSGKTTIVNLICRLLEPTEGQILVDGVPLNKIDRTVWRRSLAVASQDVELAAGTVAQNIAYGVPGASMNDIVSAAKLADAHDFITAMPQGYDTEVGHRGESLSAGQRQRVALARARLFKPHIQILDEATNALDGLSEAGIFQTLKSRAGRLTTVVISHHGGPVSICDDVVLLENGRVVQAGPANGIGLQALIEKAVT